MDNATQLRVVGVDGIEPQPPLRFEPSSCRWRLGDRRITVQVWTYREWEGVREEDRPGGATHCRGVGWMLLSLADAKKEAASTTAAQVAARLRLVPAAS